MSNLHVPLRETDPKVYRAIENERARQEGINLIASESYASEAVLEAMSCVMTNKYAEGYPHRRYYGGCENVDVVETLAIERAKKLFGVDHVNVQPHSGTQANMAVYMSVLDPGDTILSMDLSHGGHLSHGHEASFSGWLYNTEHYQVSKETGQLDYSEVAAIARKTHPDLIICGYSAYPRTINFKAFREIADEVGAFLMADIAHIAGLVAAGVHPSPAKYADFITTTTHKTLRGPRGGMIMCTDTHADRIDKAVFPGVQGGPFMHIIAAKAVAFKEAFNSQWREMQHQIVRNAKRLAKELSNSRFDLVSGGTDNHLMLVDLRSKGLTGKKAEEALANAGITLNKNTIPFDPKSPFVTSGVRIGPPCVTMRGMKEEEMRSIAKFIQNVLEDPESEEVQKKVNERVRTLCEKFPVYTTPQTSESKHY
ncbi:MAG: serine hydroxymethyltransferase [Candidatus Korarchaeota archaeon]|nr:serine hydroxymethyltransferase [Candidatus Korarchaeota archaeon]NIU84646.1 aminotransferase class I/II-fold pyridoxal phosphate-dependent enzyme [Candidatus Thorarchaeota archaeon]NIW14672.1 aminotransferase class I/II-fold pyridoxal phosphate-dependent enzyme [Candidatus Thorarchaeota archaeon]NIW52748.1 aminotransferase class I/II-fold pyridoxal phosphate-dependent enzyme [Candidatus Korarchaeota archaeon]